MFMIIQERDKSNLNLRENTREDKIAEKVYHGSVFIYFINNQDNGV